MLRSSRSLLAVLMLVAAFGGAQPAFAESSSAGTPKFVLRMTPSFNRFVESPSPAFESWMNQNFWRTEVFTPYFDEETSWYPHGLVYRDLYALYAGSAEASEHPEWILHGASGEPLYIPWGCSDGSCPQYAGDVGNPAFRHAWIAEAKAEMQKGYAGLWIDDVNLDFRVGNGAGEQVAPIDPRTGQRMSETAWREYVDTFLEEIRQALPGAELLENSIWYAGGPERWKDPLVERQIATANYINLERGVNDEGLTGGTGEWSLKSLLSFIDYVHSAGKGVILDGWDNSPAGREYSLAAYYLISTGSDGIGNGYMTPEDWWPAYNYNLGTPEGPRTEWEGLLRRNYTNGISLVNEPNAPTRTITLPAPMYNTEGTILTSITLHAANGAVLRYVESPGPHGVSEGTGPTKKAPNGNETAESGEAPPTMIKLSERSTKRGQKVILSGRVSSTSSDEVQVRIQRLDRGQWVQVSSVTAPLGGAGRFHVKLEHPTSGRYQAQATVPAAGAATASSGAVGFTVPTQHSVDARLAARAARARLARQARLARESRRQRG